MSAAPDRDQEKRHLLRLRHLRQAMDGLGWRIEAERDALHIVAVRGGGETDRIATIHPSASPDEVDLICAAIDSLRFLLGLLDRASARILALEGAGKPPEEPKADNRMALSAKGLCGQRTFWRYLESRSTGGWITTPAEADARLKYVLDFKSKAEMNQLGPLRDAFAALRDDYQIWKRGGP